jgi:hypothetical protein
LPDHIHILATPGRSTKAAVPCGRGATVPLCSTKSSTC